MKIRNPLMLSTALALVVTAVAGSAPLAAAPDRLTVPLSDPSKPARLEVSLVMGSIHVIAGKAGEVAIGADTSSQGDDDDAVEDGVKGGIEGGVEGGVSGEPVIVGKARDRDKDKEKDKRDRAHMHRLPNNSLDLSAEEDKNRVKIEVNSWSHSIDLEVRVPEGSSLQLSTVNDGDIEVTGITGELDLSNTNGDITVKDARGPVNANTVNGDVKVNFSGALAQAPMAFSTLNGDLDLTLPADVRLNVRLRSDNGDIYSDFDVALEPKAAQVQQDRSKGKYKVSIAKELSGRIGGGGPELFLKTFNGDVVLRKR